jgi:hypothetical protein
MANATKSDATKPGNGSRPADGRMTRELVPLEKRLGRLRKEEAKRKHQLEVVQARSERTKGKMAALLASVNEWVQNPAAAGEGSPAAH